MIRSFTTHNSSHVKKVMYGTEAETLSVEYQNGRVYVYKFVPVEVYDALVLAPSVGKFLNEHIYGWYDCQRVS